MHLNQKQGNFMINIGSILEFIAEDKSNRAPGAYLFIGGVGLCVCSKEMLYVYNNMYIYYVYIYINILIE